MKYSTLRGTKDILPEEVHLWQYIEEIAENIFELYNYKEIRTPIFEMTDLFTNSIGEDTDIVEKEMYTFKDKGERSVTLRPEGTAPVVRSYIQNGLSRNDRIVKYYYKGPMFRYERPQAGRFRQFHQMGVECLGSKNPLLDAEIISLGVHIFDEMGVSDLSVLINTVGCPVCRKVIRESVKGYVGDSLKYLCPDCQRRFNNNPLRILDCKNEKCGKYLVGLPKAADIVCRECKDHFNTVLEYLDYLDIDFSINPRLVRGLDYYTKTTFEIVSANLGAHNAVCGGGRYDNLVKALGGHDVPAVGFAFGLERAVMVLKELKVAVNHQEQVDLFITAIGQDAKLKGFLLMDDLRRGGFKVDIDYGDRSLKGQMKYADKIKAKYVLIIGEEECEKGTAVVKEMTKGGQEEVNFDDIEDYLREKIE